MLDIYGRGATCAPENFFFSKIFFLLLCELEIGAYLWVIMYVGKGGLAVKFVRVKVGFEVAVGNYLLYDEMG